jgi:SAM-dependent methyltransferase
MPTPPPTRAYDWDEIARFWKGHSRGRGQYERGRDPDGLNNVCQSGAPLFVNRYYQRAQRQVYRSLLAAVPRRGPSSLALDVGCGTGRWSQLLSEHGFDVTGIDIQDSVIEANRLRYPGIQFEACQVQDFRTTARFDLVSTVTVLQHLPYQEQERAVANLANLLTPAGHTLILENILDTSGPLMFARTRQGWVDLFGRYGLALVRSRPYDYSPALRSYYALSRSLRGRFGTGNPAELPAPEELGVREEGDLISAVRGLDGMAKSAASCIDSVVEPVLVWMEAPLPTVHHGMLFARQAT